MQIVSAPHHQNVVLVAHVTLRATARMYAARVAHRQSVVLEMKDAAASEMGLEMDVGET